MFSTSFGANLHLRVPGHHFGAHTATKSHRSLCLLFCIFLYTFLFWGSLDIQFRAFLTRRASLPQNISPSDLRKISSLLIRGPGLGSQSLPNKTTHYLGNQLMPSVSVSSFRIAITKVVENVNYHLGLQSFHFLCRTSEFPVRVQVSPGSPPHMIEGPDEHRQAPPHPEAASGRERLSSSAG